MTHARPTWKFAADTYLLKLQRLPNRVLRAVGDLDRNIPVRDLHFAFKIPYVYDYITNYGDRQKSSKITQIQILREPIHRKYKKFKLGGGQAYHCSSD